MSAGRGVVAVAVAVLGAFAVLAAGALAAAPVKVSRCGYVTTKESGRLALYPWHLSCAAARTALVESQSPKDPMIELTADGAFTFDAGPVKFGGQWWVCGGRMGYYFCGYPYRPATAHGAGGGTTYKGHFTKEFVDEGCDDGPGLCGTRAETFQPPVSYP